MWLPFQGDALLDSTLRYGSTARTRLASISQYFVFQKDERCERRDHGRPRANKRDHDLAQSPTASRASVQRAGLGHRVRVGVCGATQCITPVLYISSVFSHEGFQLDFAAFLERGRSKLPLRHRRLWLTPHNSTGRLEAYPVGRERGVIACDTCCHGCYTKPLQRDPACKYSTLV